eukprot:9430404-Lingulodinium_polyedra.AAC.1
MHQRQQKSRRARRLEWLSWPQRLLESGAFGAAGRPFLAFRKACPHKGDASRVAGRRALPSLGRCVSSGWAAAAATRNAPPGKKSQVPGQNALTS